MKKGKVFCSMEHIDLDLIDEAETYKRAKKNTWVKWTSIAACLCLVIGVAFRIAPSLKPSQMTDIFREGNLIEISSENELPAQYDGKLLAFNLGFEQYEFYYKADGSAENTDDWYSLLASKNDANGDILLHCMFGETSIEDWKVSKVFTPKATQIKTINGIEVQIARCETSLKYDYWNYAIFEFDNAVYDIRVASDNPEYVYSVLDTLIKVVDNCVREIGIGRETLKPFPIEITEEDASTLSKIINSGTWIDQPAECESDCEINLKGHMVYYNSANGILNVYNLKELSTYSSKELEVGGKSLVLSEKDRTTVNTILEKYITLGFKSN